MTKKRNFKYWILQIHLWLGLASGLVVLIVSITGCLFVFQKEISEITFRKTLFVTAASTPVLPVSELQKKAQTVLGTSQPLNYIITYKQPDRAWEFMTYKTNDTALTYFGAVEYFRSVYINPYNGQVTGIRDYKYDFFNIVKYLHWSLLLNTPYGQPIVGWSTVIFVILLISGLVLWWPKKWNKTTRQQSFKIKWKAKFKRVNYDLHNVLGFYSMLLALVIALTGMVFAFKWFEATVYVVASGTTTPPKEAVVKSIKPNENVTFNAVDKAYLQSKNLYPTVDRIGVTPAYGPDGAIYISAYRGEEVYYKRDDLQFDQYSGQLLHTQLSSKKNRGEKLLEMNYDIHVGAIGGLTGKIVAFVISLICASLPVTGLLVWLGKMKKNKKFNASVSSKGLRNKYPAAVNQAN